MEVQYFDEYCETDLTQAERDFLTWLDTLDTPIGFVEGMPIYYGDCCPIDGNQLDDDDIPF